jgi:hypothetical protein
VGWSCLTGVGGGREEQGAAAEAKTGNMKRVVGLSTNITEQNRVLENVAQSLKSNTLLKRTHGIISTLARAIVEKQHAKVPDQLMVDTSR